MSPRKLRSTDPEVRGSFAALRRAARSARKLSKATGAPFYVMKKGRIVDLNARRGKSDLLELRQAKQSEGDAPAIGLKELKRRLGLRGNKA